MMELLLESLWNVVLAVAVLVWTLLLFLAPWTPLIAWVAFWLFAVDWRRLYPVLMKGAWVGVLLTALLAILIWSSVAIPEEGSHRLFGLQVGNMAGKTVYVTSLLVIAILCGAVQLSGCCGVERRWEEPASGEH